MSLHGTGLGNHWRRLPVRAATRGVICVVVVLFAISCQRHAVQNDLCAVRGKVSFKDAKPLTGGKVAFHNLDEDEKFVLHAAIGDDGQFELRYGAQSGAPVGKYKVVIVPDPPSDPKNPPAGWPPVHRDFTKVETTRLTLTVTPGENVCDFTVWK